jgi:hypothetical protein
MSIEQDCITVLTNHLGPAAPSFLSRQCKFHLKKEPADLLKADLEELAKWVYIGVSLTLDKTVAEEVKTNILALK